MNVAGSTRADARGARTFREIWLAIFLSSVATFFLLIVLSAEAIAAGHSWTLANVIVMTQWIPAVAALPLIKHLSRNVPARRLLVTCELGTLGLYPLVALLAATTAPLLAVLLAKGLLDNVSKVSRPVALRTHLDGVLLHGSAAYYNVAALAGSGLGSLLGAVAFGRVDLLLVLSGCAAAHAVSAWLYSRLSRVDEGGRGATGVRTPRHPLSPNVRSAVCLYVASVVLFQGVHNIVRSYYPVDVLGLAPSSVGTVQTITSFAYIGGALVAARLLVGDGYWLRACVVHASAAASMVLLPFVESPGAGLVAYAAFAFLFEVGFALHLRTIMVEAPASRLGELIADANAWSMGSMVVLAITGSVVIDHVGMTTVTLVSAALAFLALALALHARSRELHQTTDSTPHEFRS